ncbi:hypothetical protein BH23THE1_BH23THE1_28640 [soil metagenome]
MVSTEYPPMHGGVGRYTENLVRSLLLKGLEVEVVSDSHGAGRYHGLSPYNKKNLNSNVLTTLVNKIKPDIVHIQHEHGLYYYNQNPLYPLKSYTGLDDFYEQCNVPIVTTFHTSMYFKQWMQLVNVFKKKKDLLNLNAFYNIWRHFINYYKFHSINKHIMAKSSCGIVFSNYLRQLIPDTTVVYHGSEPHYQKEISKAEARNKLDLPQNGRLALAQGFFTNTKGWDMIKNIQMPENWKLVINYSKNFYNKENIEIKLPEENIINLNKDYLTEEELSLVLFAVDALFMPYKVSSGSGTMFDGLGHGKPFIASDLGFFREFSEMNLGIVSKRDPNSFEKAFIELDRNYQKFELYVKEFRKKILWDNIADQHLRIYTNLVEKAKRSIGVTRYHSDELIHDKITTQSSNYEKY